MKMLRYEIKKVFSKSKNRIAVIVLFVILVITSILTINKVEFVDENGNSSVGISASRDLREAKNQWAGYLTTDTLSKAHSVIIEITIIMCRIIFLMMKLELSMKEEFLL